MITDMMVAHECQCRKLREASRKITRVYDDALRPLGIKANQLTILIGVSLMGPVSITQLADELGMDRTTLTRNFSPLEKEGFIELKAGRGRTRNAMITSKGKKLIEKAKPKWKVAQSQIIGRVGKQKLNELNGTLVALFQEEN